MSFNIPAMQNPSVMKHNFSQIPHADIQRSSFKRSHGYKTTLEAGYLYPIYADEALPGDTFKVNLSSVARLMTALGKPIMDNLYMDFFFFAVPNRLVWDNWQKFMGEKEPDDTTDYLVPQIQMGANPVVANTLGDYFGIPTKVNNLEFNSLHFRAYNLIYNDWFRDQNLQDSVVVDKDDGPDAIADYVLLRRGKRHDYFTSCLPWPQKGTAVDLPLGTSAPIHMPGAFTHPVGVYSDTQNKYVQSYAASGTAYRIELGSTELTAADSLYADLSTATSATINDLREAFQIQKLMERDARGGTRYTEILKSHFGVTSPDARLQRPEYLGGGTKRIMVEPVPTTNYSNTVLDAKVGILGATAYMNSSGIGFTKSFVEHSLIIGLVNIRADLTYQTGLNKMWSRQTKYDYYWPALAHLGEQAVLNKELYAQGTAADDLVFGYQERWAEYRYHPSLITGTLRSNHAASLDLWHLSQDFSGLPALDASFIVEAPPVARVVAVTSEDKFIIDNFFDVIATRPMPTYSVPGLIDHF